MIEYVELHCHSSFSLLDGASSPEALVRQAAALGYRALALTDHDGLYGAVRFWQAAKEQGIRPIVGAEVALEGLGHLTLLAESREGYANLCRLLSAGQLAGQKGQPRLSLDTLAQHAGGLVGLSGCRQGVVASALQGGGEGQAVERAGRLREALGRERFWIEIQRQFVPGEGRLEAGLADVAERLGLGLVATAPGSASTTS